MLLLVMDIAILVAVGFIASIKGTGPGASVSAARLRHSVGGIRPSVGLVRSFHSLAWQSLLRAYGVTFSMYGVALLLSMSRLSREPGP